MKNIDVYIHPKIKILDQIDCLFQTKFNLDKNLTSKILEKHIAPVLDSFKDDIYAVIEYPYVDKMYRDAYYNYYSNKSLEYNRDCIRISFFDKEIFIEDFRSEERKKELEKIFLGFIVLRPTFPKVIGRCSLSPRIKKDSDFVCCQVRINTTVNSVKFKVLSFPYASQDNQTIKCAETTIWTLLEYFGNKYPEYKPVLPSFINRIIYKFSYKRLVPSDGLTAEQISYAIRELGFDTTIYSKKKYGDDFNSIISMYVESGIPVVGVLKNNIIGHTILIIGRETDKIDKIINHDDFFLTKDNVKIIDYNKVDKDYILIDDNHPPFQKAKLEKTCQGYYTDTRFHDCELTSIIVPLSPKIYLDAVKARQKFIKILDTNIISVEDDNPLILKSFLVSSRSYKEYIAFNKEIAPEVKELILNMAMPKFVWLAEISKKETFKAEMCDGILMQDSTEPLEYHDESYSSVNSFMFSYFGGKIFINNFGRFKKINTFANPFSSYQRNLK